MPETPPPTCEVCGGNSFTNGELCTNCYGCGRFPITGYGARTMKMIADFTALISTKLDALDLMKDTLDSHLDVIEGKIDELGS